jgi:hypothetical protein
MFAVGLRARSTFPAAEDNEIPLPSLNVSEFKPGLSLDLVQLLTVVFGVCLDMTSDRGNFRVVPVFALGTACPGICGVIRTLKFIFTLSFRWTSTASIRVWIILIFFLFFISTGFFVTTELGSMGPGSLGAFCGPQG